MKQCIEAGCEEQAHARGMCAKHYRAHRAKQPGLCERAGCDKRIFAVSLCRSHYDRRRRWEEREKRPCAVEGCESGSWAKGYCSMHYQRWKATGDPGPAKRFRAKPGEGAIENGYRTFAAEPGRKARRVREHRLIMEQLLGRALLPGETVHHCNTIRNDNRIDGPLDAEFRSGNLQLWTKSQPSGGRVVDKVAWAVELLELYAPELLATGRAFGARPRSTQAGATP